MLALKFTAGLPPDHQRAHVARLRYEYLPSPPPSTTLAPAKVVHLKSVGSMKQIFSIYATLLITPINYLEKPAVKLLNCW